MNRLNTQEQVSDQPKKIGGSCMILTGGCFCGRVHYTISAPLKSARSCHCSRCRKAFSGTRPVYAEIEPGSFAWTTGEASLVRHESQTGWG